MCYYVTCNTSIKSLFCSI